MYIKYSKMDREVVRRYHLYWVLIRYRPCLHLGVDDCFDFFVVDGPGSASGLL